VAHQGMHKAIAKVIGPRLRCILTMAPAVRTNSNKSKRCQIVQKCLFKALQVVWVAQVL
jgi:hypothetical protein